MCIYNNIYEIVCVMVINSKFEYAKDKYLVDDNGMKYIKLSKINQYEKD